MEKIRIENDFVLQVAVTRGGNPEDFSGLQGDVEITLKHVAYPEVEIVPAKVERVDSQLNVSVTSDLQVTLGKYRLTLSYKIANGENPNGFDVVTFDMVAFELVAHSDQALIDGDVQMVIISADTAIGTVYKGEKGASAFVTWLALPGNEGKTEAEFIASIKGDTGDSAFQAWLGLAGNAGKTVEDFFATFGKGDAGASAYELWLELPGNAGKTIEEFFATFGKGDAGASAYELWSAITGNENKTEAEFFASLNGTDGLSAYATWLAIEGNEGKSKVEFIASLKGATGDSAYQAWVGIAGNAGKTVEEFMASIKGATGLSAYGVWLLQAGNAGKTVEEYLLSLKGYQGYNAFQLWSLEEGNEGKTIDDYYAYLRQPASNAANVATEAAFALVNQAVSNLAPAPISFTDQEETCGTFNIAGKVRTIYGRSFVVSLLPKTAGETAEFDISNEPLGFNLFVKVDSIVISESSEKATAEFFMSMYEVTKVYTNSNLHTIVVIKCKETTLVDYVAKLKLLYVKFFGDVVEFDVTVPVGVDASAVNLTFPKLKYNKSFLCSYSADDSPAHFYDRIFTLVNNLPVNPVGGVASYVHVGQVVPPDNVRPGKTLGYTDGCGIYHRFTCGIAIWPNNFTGANTPYMGDTIPLNYSQPNIRWTDLPLMLDYGWTVYQHDVGDTFNPNNVDSIVEGFAVDQEKTKRILGRAQKIVMEPNGNDKYFPAVVKSPRMVAIVSQKTDPDYYPLTSDIDLLDKNLTRRFLPLDTWEQESAYIQASVYTQNPKPWYHLASHTPGVIVQGTLKEIDRLYGAEALDTVWFTTVDEYYEYVFMIRNSVASKTVTGQNIHYKLYIPNSENFYYRSLTVLLSGISSITGVDVTSSENCKGTSFGINSGSLMVNLDFNTNLLALCEKYVAKFETTNDSYDYADALYFVNMLKVGVKEPYLARVNALVGNVTLNGLAINSGAANTVALGVTLTPAFSGPTSAYMASENADFAGAEWAAYTGGSIPFTLANTLGLHTVYFKLKNAAGESVVVTDTITYTVVELMLTGVSINDEAASTNSRNVTLGLSYSGSTPTHYMASENADFSGASWVAFVSNPAFTLSAGGGVKTVYVKLMNSYYTTAASSDSITYSVVAFALTGVTINSGDSGTASKDVNVAMTATGDLPTHYRIGESSDLSAVAWIAYTSNVIPFTLSAGYGIKTVYLQIKTATETSSVLSDTINSIEPLSITTVVINSGDEVTVNNSVNVAVNTAGSAPTHYMASENADFAGAEWVAFASPFSFDLSENNEVKTIYVKVKNDYFTSDAASDTITRNVAAAAVAAVVSFAASVSNAISYVTLATGDVLNYTTLSINNLYSAKQLQSKAGVALPWYLEMNESLYPINAESIQSGKYLNGTTGQQPTLTGNAGVYPDMYINKAFNLQSSGTGGTAKGRIVFTLPVGTYKIKVLDSVSTASAITSAQLPYCFYKIAVNDVSGTPVQAGPTGFTGANNNQFNAEIDFVVASAAAAGNVVLYIYNTNNINYKPGVNLVEIIKVS